MSAQSTHTLIITRIAEQGRDVRSFDMRPRNINPASPDRVFFTAGQIAVLRPGSEWEPSHFAFAGAPEDPELEFLIKCDGQSAGSVIYNLHSGDSVELLGVVGKGFELDRHKGRDLVFVAMGTGVAPLRSALRHALNRGNEFGQIVVLYGARTPDDFCYRDEMEAWKAAGVELRLVISSTDGYEWAGSTGYVQSLLDHVLPNLNSPVALVSGSRQMVDQTRDRLQEMGFEPETILTNF